MIQLVAPLEACTKIFRDQVKNGDLERFLVDDNAKSCDESEKTYSERELPS